MTDLRDMIPNANAAELELVARYAMLPDDPRRERAFTAFAETGLPHRRMEAWKWTDFKAALSVLQQPGAVAAVDPFGAVDAFKIMVDQGGMVYGDQLPKGVRLFEKTDAQAFGAAEEMPIGAMTAALAGRKDGLNTLMIEVTEAAGAPLHFVHAANGDETNFSRVTVLVRPGASLDLIESHLGGAGFSSALLDIGIQDGASVQRTILQRGAGDEAQAITADIHLEEGASFSQTTLAFGAKIARLETRLTHNYPSATATLNAAYLAGAGKHVDVTTHVRHAAVRGTTRQLTKGAVLDGGRGVFQGKFFVPRTIGQHTDADMQHQALLLEDGAEVFAKPELEIYADDVECAHGNTSGALDGDQLFYLRQRGLPQPEAKALLTQAFIAEALDDAPESLRDILAEEARRFLADV